VNALQLHQRISKYLNIDLELRVNDNRSTMLRILERQRRLVRLSIHQMFLEAPEDVIAAVARYVNGTSRDQGAYHYILRAYIHKNSSSYDYRQRLDETALQTEGQHYDLQVIYDQLNQQYFQGKLQCRLTWYGILPLPRRTRRLTFGLYYESLKLIKIHRILDDPFFPPYFVAYVIYHEMVHDVVPGETDCRGALRVHTPRFRQQERQFIHYERALAWERSHKEKIFRRGWT